VNRRDGYVHAVTQLAVSASGSAWIAAGLLSADSSTVGVYYYVSSNYLPLGLFLDHWWALLIHKVFRSQDCRVGCFACSAITTGKFRVPAWPYKKAVLGRYTSQHWGTRLSFRDPTPNPQHRHTCWRLCLARHFPFVPAFLCFFFF